MAHLAGCSAGSLPLHISSINVPEKESAKAAAENKRERAKTSFFMSLSVYHFTRQDSFWTWRRGGGAGTRAEPEPFSILRPAEAESGCDPKVQAMEEEVLGKIYDGAIMRRLLGYMWPYRTRIAFSLVCLFVYSTVQVCGPLLTKLTIDKYLAPTGKATLLDRWLAPDPYTGVFQIAVLYLGVLTVGFLAEFGQTWLMQITGQYAMFDLRKQLMSHLQRLDVSFYDENPVGRLVTRVTSDVDVLNDLFSHPG